MASHTAPKWRKNPVKEIAHAWLRLLWIAPLTAILGYLASGFHTSAFDNPLLSFTVLSLYNTLIFVFLLGWNLVLLTFIAAACASRFPRHLGFLFWCALAAVYVLLAYLAAAHAFVWIDGLDGPGVGPSLSVTCDLQAGGKPSCEELEVFRNRIFWVTAVISFLLFGLDVKRLTTHIVD